MHRSQRHRLSFRVPDLVDVKAAEPRVRLAGGRVLHAGAVPHAKGAASGAPRCSLF